MTIKNSGYGPCPNCAAPTPAPSGEAALPPQGFPTLTNVTPYGYELLRGVYVASRASLPERGKMWRDFRDQGVSITSSWIDEDGEGQTHDFSELWARIACEIAASTKLVLYAETGDFPLKGALIEVGIALGMGKKVVVCLPNVELQPRSYRPVGSWINHPLVSREDDVRAALTPPAEPKEKK